MKRVFLLFFMLVATAWLAAPIDARARTIVKAQKPCAASCVDIDTAGTTVEARRLRFKAPGKGTAVVGFSGTLYCVNNRTALSFVEISAQIMGESGEPQSSGPGGLRFLKSYEGDGGLARLDSFNLAVTRKFTIKRAGIQIYRLRVHPSTLPVDVSCKIFSGAFTVTFHPK